MTPTQPTAVADVNRNNRQIIKMRFSPDRDTIDKIKTLSGRTYNAEGKFWTCPLVIESVKSLRDWGFKLDTTLQDYLNPQATFKPKPVVIPGLHGTLFPYQNEGVSFFEWRKGRAICGDEMGLGKTIQAIAWLQLRQELRPVIIVVQASLKLMWAEQCETWMGHPDVQVLYGTNADEPITADIIIVNYEILTHWVNRLIALKPKVLIIDEIHSLMHSKAKQTKATMKLGRRCAHVIGLGGTLILNRPMEGYNAIKLIEPTVVPATSFEFGMEYANGHHNGFGWVFNGASNTGKLHDILQSIMIRRLKKDVLPQLPEKLRTVIPLEITNRTEYEEAEEDFINWMKWHCTSETAARLTGAIALTHIEILKQVAVKGKLRAVRKWIDEFLESGQKLVAFTTHHFTLDYLMDSFEDEAVCLVGGMKSEDSNNVVKRFQTDKHIRLLIGMIDSRGRPAGVGHTLTAASSTAFVELQWSPGIHTQAEDRVHRIGQTADSVNAYYLLANNTIEVKIAKLLDKKRKVVDQVLDGIETEESSLLTELLHTYEEGVHDNIPPHKESKVRKNKR